MSKYINKCYLNHVVVLFSSFLLCDQIYLRTLDRKIKKIPIFWICCTVSFKKEKDQIKERQLFNVARKKETLKNVVNLKHILN